MGVFEQVLSIFSYQSNHIVILTDFFVHLNSQIWFLNCDEEFFCVLEIGSRFQFLTLLNVKLNDVIRWEIVFGQSKSLIPFLGTNVHFKGIYWLSSLQEIFLSKILLSNLAVMFGDLSEKRSADFRTLALKQLNSFTPLFGVDCSFNSFLETSGFNIVVHCTFSLFLAHQPIAPSFFKTDHKSRLSSFSQIHGLAEGKTFTVTIQGFL